jgi:hypothetical protein
MRLVVPITDHLRGPVGSASVEEVDGELVVEFYLIQGYSLRDRPKAELAQQLKNLARRKSGC